MSEDIPVPVVEGEFGEFYEDVDAFVAALDSQVSGPFELSTNAIETRDAVITNVTLILGPLDRLRVLFGHSIELRVRVQTEHVVGRTITDPTHVWIVDLFSWLVMRWRMRDRGRGFESPTEPEVDADADR